MHTLITLCLLNRVELQLLNDLVENADLLSMVSVTCTVELLDFFFYFPFILGNEKHLIIFKEQARSLQNMRLHFFELKQLSAGIFCLVFGYPTRPDKVQDISLSSFGLKIEVRIRQHVGLSVISQFLRQLQVGIVVKQDILVSLQNMLYIISIAPLAKFANGLDDANCQLSQ